MDIFVFLERVDVYLQYSKILGKICTRCNAAPLPLNHIGLRQITTTVEYLAVVFCSMSLVCCGI